MKRLFITAFLVLAGNSSAGEIPELVLRHAPVYVGRRDQIRNPNTDRILGVGYSILEKRNGVTAIRYTTFFSDEDSMRGKANTDHQMARYGRRLDIEWTYEVQLDPRTGAPTRRSYHCDIFLGMGHKTCTFRGNFYQNSDRPVLYVTARHNIFGDHPEFPSGSKKGRVTVQDPNFEIPFPMSRDLVPVLNPEMLRASDEELAREKKLSHPSTEYAFLRVRGTLVGRMHLSIVDPSGIVYQNGMHTDDTLRELGLDLWGRESVVGIHLPESVRLSLKNGVGGFRFGFSNAFNQTPTTATLTLEDVGLYLVDKTAEGTYATSDLSSRVRCADPTKLESCSIH